MSDREKTRTGAGAPARAARLSEELRANLARRKAQARSRKAQDEPAKADADSSHADEKTKDR